MEIMYNSSGDKITLNIDLSVALISLIILRDFWLFSVVLKIQILINPSNPLDINIEESFEEHNPYPSELCGFF